MECIWYDDFEQITLHCANLESFHRLLAARRKAWFERKEYLHEFIVHGVWFLDKFGQCGKFQKPEVYEEAKKDYVLVQFDFPSVITTASFVKNIPPDASWGHSFGGSSSFPVPAGRICPSCGKSWTVADSGSFFEEKSEESMAGRRFVGKTLEEVRAIFNENKTVLYTISPFPISNPEWVDMSPRYKEDDGSVKNERGWAKEARSGASVDFPVVDRETYLIKDGDTLHFEVCRFWHVECHAEKLANERFIEFGNALMKAGFGILSARQVENEYGSGEWRGPWWEFKTEHGKIRLGWRKRVIDMDFSDVAPMLVVSADTTKSPGFAHAWTLEDATKFLQLAKEAKSASHAEVRVLVEHRRAYRCFFIR